MDPEGGGGGESLPDLSGDPSVDLSGVPSVDLSGVPSVDLDVEPPLGLLVDLTPGPFTGVMILPLGRNLKSPP